MASCQVQRLLGNSDRSLGLGGHVGFHTLPDQLVNKSVNKGFDFNVLCVGETGCGKSTLMESLFKQDFKEQPVTHQLPEVGITATTHRLQEGNVKLRLTLVSTKGYGDQIDKSNSIKPLLDYIDEQFESYLQEELKIKRDLVNFHDTRVHVCLYFISPTGHSIKSLDLVCMQQLDKKVNIIPVIAKADTISRTELQEFKGRIMRELVNNGIEIYQFPVDDETFAENNARMNEQLPFAVVGSRDEMVVGGQKVRARIYPWGTVEVENESHCDFVKLREMILRTNMEDLRESTHTKHYEMFRRERLHQRGFADTMDNRPVSLQETYEKKRKELQLEMKTKEEQMRHTFVQKVKDKEAELKAAEHRLHEEFERLRKKHQEDKAALEEKKRGLDEEISFFNQKKAAIQAQRAQTELYHKSKQQRK